MSFSNPNQYPRPPSVSAFAWPRPYQGAPPPIPAGINVNPRQWNTGVWQVNPHFKHTAPVQNAPHVPWIPGQAWQQQQQPQQQQQQQQPGGAAYNPYKRVTKPPSAEYLANKLSDNPLGLSNMIPAEDIPEEVAHTPWIWAPRGLDPEPSTSTSTSTSTRSRRASDGNPSSSSLNLPASNGHRQRRDPSLPRQASEPYTSNAHQAPPRHASEPPQDRRGFPDHSTTRSASAHPPGRTSPPTFTGPLIGPTDPNSLYNLRRFPNGMPPSAARSTDPWPQPAAPPKEDETFTSKQELRPTFSSGIVRTPEHYQNPSPSRNSSQPSPSRNSTPANSRSNSHGSAEFELVGRMDRLSTNTSSLGRRSSVPYPSSSEPNLRPQITNVSSFSDEPSSMLSPLIIGATPKPPSRQMSRHSSVPVVGGPSLNSLSSIPESTYPHPPKSTSRPSPTSRTSSTRTSPATSSSSDRHITPPTSGRASNPLPPPPVEIRYPVPAPQPQRDPPSSYRTRVRNGFWNRRGDHLTFDGFIVYAPPEHANPPDLRGYPAEIEGYRDHLGATIAYSTTRPELPESLPRHGKPPQRPYESFIRWEYHQ